VFAFYEWASNKEQQTKLLDELKRVDIYDRKQLQQAMYLTAIVNEALLLHFRAEMMKVVPSLHCR
jgi:hypothetical protein